MSVAALQLQLLLAEPGDWLQLLGLGRDGCYRRTCLFYVSVYLSLCPSIFPSMFLGGRARLALPVRRLRSWGSALSGTAGAAAVSPRPCRALLGLLAAGSQPLRAPKLGPCVCVRVRVCVCVQGLGCAPLGSEPAPAGDGLNVLFPVLTSAIKRSIPASPNHFLNPTGVFTGGKESRSAPRNASVGVFYLFKIFLLLFFMVA